MRERGWLAVIVVGLVAGAIGVGLVLAGRHLWLDHLALHELAVIEMQRQQPQGGQK